MDYSEDAKNFFFNEENKKKKNEIMKKFGGEFHKEDSKLSPELENIFLNNVMRFEEEWENAEEIEMYEYLGNPKIKNLEDIKEDDLPIEIDKVLEIYNRKNININVLEEEDVTNEDFYKFLTEELPKHKFYPMPLSGMTTNFIYEEFHPSDKLDAKNAIEDVLLSAITKNKEFAGTFVADENLLSFDNKQITKEEFLNNLFSLFKDVEEEIDREIKFNKFEFADENKVNADLILTYKSKGRSIEIQKRFSFIFKLIKSKYGGMEIINYIHNEKRTS